MKIMKKYFSKTNLVITRSGSSTLAELSITNTPFVAVPLATSKDNHQLENANFYKNKDFNYIFGNDFFNFKNSKDLVIKLNELSNADIKEIFYRLKNIKSVLEKNSLKTLNQRLINYL